MLKRMTLSLVATIALGAAAYALPAGTSSVDCSPIGVKAFTLQLAANSHATSIKETAPATRNFGIEGLVMNAADGIRATTPRVVFPDETQLVGLPEGRVIGNSVARVGTAIPEGDIGRDKVATAHGIGVTRHGAIDLYIGGLAISTDSPVATAIES